MLVVVKRELPCDLALAHKFGCGTLDTVGARPLDVVARGLHDVTSFRRPQIHEPQRELLVVAPKVSKNLDRTAEVTPLSEAILLRVVNSIAVEVTHTEAIYNEASEVGVRVGAMRK